VFSDINGGWTIVGVNNRAPGPATSASFGTYMLSFWFNSTFGSFYNTVVQLIGQGA
jgi:hypothetical protein